MRNLNGQFIKGGGEGFKKGHKLNVGRKASPEAKRKMSLKLMGNKHTLGFKHTEETKKLMSEKQKGKKKSEEHKKKISLSHFGKTMGEKNGSWHGGKSFLPYTTDWTKTLKRSIRERDNYVCFICKALQSDVTFVVHHIDYNKANCNPDNLITLCPSCHTRTNSNRDYWINYFNI